MSNVKPLNILVIEDDPDWFNMLTALLTNAGHTVTHIIGVRNRRADRFIGISREETEMPLDVSQFDLVLVDGKLKETNVWREHWGWDIIPYLDFADLPCIGISSEPVMNQRMVDAGAVFGIVKDDLRRGLPHAIAHLNITPKKDTSHG